MVPSMVSPSSLYPCHTCARLEQQHQTLPFQLWRSESHKFSISNQVISLSKCKCFPCVFVGLRLRIVYNKYSKMKSCASSSLQFVTVYSDIGKTHDLYTTVESYGTPDLQLRRVVAHPEWTIGEENESLVIVGNYGTANVLRSAESALVAKEVVELPDFNALVLQW
ncbi:hypothetical protein GOP47_0030997 [Adiantum capillus-veneris]|nr:hypothetical protein GOP47_0030997 [Adiantum capillus-veneris]